MSLGPIGYALDINAAGTSKHYAAQKLFEMIGVDRDQVVAVGDSYNDYPLLSACGTKVAMGNAVDELKEIADFIAPSQDEDGVVAVIEKYFSQ